MTDKRRGHRAGLLPLTLTVALLAACIGARAVEVTDSTGRTVQLDKPAQRIVALAPHIVENLFSAGAGEQLVGVVSYSNYPAAATRIPIVGGYHAFSLEKILALQPDLIVTWAEGNGDNAARPFEALGVPVYIDEPRQLEDVARSIRNLGILSGNAGHADSVADQFLHRLKQLRQQHATLRKVSVFYQVWNKPLQTINDEHIISAVISVCGGHNIFNDTPVIAPKVSVESVISRNPETIIASGMDQARPEWLDEWLQYPDMTAVRKNNLYFIPPDILQRHTVRILQGAEQMCDSLQTARQHLSAPKS